MGVQLYVFCTRCERHTSSKGVKLNQLCVPERSGQLNTLKKLLEGKHPEKGNWISLAGQARVLRWREGLFETHSEEQDRGGEVEDPPWHENNQYTELQQLEEQWEQLRQQIVLSPHWQAGSGLEQVNGEWGFDEPTWQMGEEIGAEEML